ncbi:MAG: Eco57I restriction-modification methylase domain-containing protein [Candidatus Hodarchaeota archaeon]
MTNINKDFEIYEQKKITLEIKEWIKFCKSNYNLKIPDTLFYSSEEFFVSVLAGLWLLQFFNSYEQIDNSLSLLRKLKEIKTQYPMAKALWNYLEILFGILIEDNNLESILSVEFPELNYALENDILGTILQKSLGFDDRKKLAANYTNIKSANILVSLIQPFNPSSVVDPSCGSGRLVTAFLKTIDSVKKVTHIRINDIMPSAVLIAYCRIALKLSKFNQDFHILEASIGDAFEIFSLNTENQRVLNMNYDLVLMNPPFTRSHRISIKQRKKLSKLEQRYRHFISGQLGLHGYSTFLADVLVNQNGIIALILPAAIILSDYSRGIHELLLKNYKIEIIASSLTEKSYSEDSNLREIFVIAKRRQPMNENETVNFLNILEVNKVRKYHVSSSQMVSVKRLAKEWNWTLFLRNPRLLNIRDIILSSRLIKNGKDLNLDIVRGVEMYGPDFFFIPNQFWKIINEEENTVIIQSEKADVEIPKEFLVRALRKPSKYAQYITPDVSDFALSIPNESITSQKWLKEYLDITEHLALAAKQRFGSQWISHIYNQIQTKRPWGHLFFIDKFSISSTSVLGHYFENKTSCSKNFYLIRNYDINQAKFLSAWCNSTFFILLFLCTRREIGGSYGRLQIIDYMREPLFLDFSKCSEAIKSQIILEFDKFRRVELPPIPVQIRLKKKKALDLAIARGLKIPLKEVDILLKEMYVLLEDIFIELDKRDKS